MRYTLQKEKLDEIARLMDTTPTGCGTGLFHSRSMAVTIFPRESMLVVDADVDLTYLLETASPAEIVAHLDRLVRVLRGPTVAELRQALALAVNRGHMTPDAHVRAAREIDRLQDHFSAAQIYGRMEHYLTGYQELTRTWYGEENRVVCSAWLQCVRTAIEDADRTAQQAR